MTQLRVLIVGASIAGPMTAYWLAKAGANVTIIERFSKLRTGGQNIDIRTAGVTVMRKIPGMEAAVRAKTAQVEGISFVRDDGRPYGTIKPTGNPDQQSLVSEYEIFRGDLAQILFDLTKDNENISYIFGEQVTSITQNERDDRPVTVEFQNGFPTSDYDLMVACDGSNSRTRAQGFGCDTRDYVKSINSWAAYFSMDQDLFGGSRTGHAYSSVGGRFIAAGSDPSGGTRVVLMSFQSPNSHDAAPPFLQALKGGDPALKQYIANHYRGAGWKTDELINGMMQAEDFYANEMVQVKPPSLFKGRVVLVGDAGYAGSAGSGTTLAIAGAYILAGEVVSRKDNLALALRGYEVQMKPLINDLQRIPALVPAILAPQSAWGIWLRNNIFAVIAWTRILEFVQESLMGSFAKTDKHKLPEYVWAA